ncbi:MAG: hypothetical protein AAFY52_08030, partial [Pseudomonadota bacterium]
PDHGRTLKSPAAMMAPSSVSIRVLAAASFAALLLGQGQGRCTDTSHTGALTRRPLFGSDHFGLLADLSL